MPERNKSIEISSLALARHVSVYAYVINAKRFGAIVFPYICQVVQHGKFSIAEVMEKFCKCARNYCDPCEIDTV